MRITNQWRYNQTLYDYQRNMAGVQKNYLQLSNGIKINQAYDDASLYNDGMRLDYEVETFSQVIEATSKSVNFAKNTDKSLQEFEKQLENFKTKMIQAASDVHSSTSLEALANELVGIKDHLVNIANTSVNGQFLFSGSAVDTKPIDGSGKYQGNGESMKTSAGAQIELAYNIPGKQVFLGSDNDYNKILTTNVSLIDNTKDYSNGTELKYLNEQSTIKQMVGLNYVNNKNTINSDYDFTDKDIDFPGTYFFLQGTKPDGTSFTSKFKVTGDTTLEGLMDKIGYEFGNTKGSKVVDVSINNDGQFNIKDLTKGSQVLDFHMVAATVKVDNKADLATAIADETAGNSPLEAVDTLSALQTLADNGDVHITNFIKNNFKDKASNKVDSFDYDNVMFEKSNNQLIGNISQVNRKTGEVATDSTRLSQTAAAQQLYPNSQDRYNIDNQKLAIEVKSKTGIKYTIELRLGTQDPSTPVLFTIQATDANGNNAFPTGTPATRSLAVYNADEFGEYRTQTNDFTYRQLMDIVAMAASDNIPSPPHVENATTTTEQRRQNYEAYKDAIEKSHGSVEVNLDDKGRITLTDKTQSVTNIELSIQDASESGKFYGDSTGNTAATKQGNGSVFSFMENNAVTIDEPGIDMFADLDSMIEAVRQGYYRASDENGDPRNTGMQGALQRLDHLMDHVNKEITKIGSQTNLITTTKERAELMKVNVQTVKSDIMDADYAEAYLAFTQKSLAYQAMLQATSKINQLSLLNYM
ncbi:flagellar hook-associated protein FlgL [Campylobacter sp. RM9328]|uniref:flagellar hook-associated protein FlgL n=1 Tax=Campylobacter sp. RM9328 TaxID=1705720 RepID=UPI0014734355|nr:flagellar hook-associated protein FlgL [Campylobacter sp. RM9328]